MLALLSSASAGGPRYIAGVSYFQNGLAGTPMRWFGGEIRYYTDPGSLSPMLSQSEANALVAEALERWSSVPTAALSTIHGGSLDQDVNGTNVFSSGGSVSFPADVLPASAKPLAVVYDFNGEVTETLLGQGTSAPQLCDANAVIGMIDRFTGDGYLAHAVVVINGRCAQTIADIGPLRYHLTRVFGRVLGLDWSQLNDEVAEGNAAAEDAAGYPLMHPIAALCRWNADCLLDADQPRMDDRAAISRLYPVTEANIAQFPAKTLFSETTGRIEGWIRFPSGRGMSGVNVVARLLNTNEDAHDEASRSMAASNVAGFRFQGNVGNPVTGFRDEHGERWDRFGSEDPELEGYFDLAGLEIPDGMSSARYELRVEAVRPEYAGKISVGPYRTRQVAMSGSSPAIIVTLIRGEGITRDIYMQNSTEEHSGSASHDFSAPATLPGGGVWMGALSEHGQTEYYRFSARQDRIATFEVRALGDDAQQSDVKALPLIGLWNRTAADGEPPVVRASYFNTGAPGLTQLQAQFPATGDFKIGIADFRGSGRPDFRYRARVFYADVVEPDRASTAGGTPLAIRGTGFVPGMTVSIGGAAATVQSYSPQEIKVLAPVKSDGTASIELFDPDTGARAHMINALRYGGTAQDTVTLVSAGNPHVPVGSEAPFPITVRVSGPDSETVPGASVQFTSGPSVLLLPCNATVCSLVTNEVGEASVTVLVKSAGIATITATLASGASVSSTVSGMDSALAVIAMPSRVYMARNSSGSMTLRAQVIENGAAAPGKTVRFTLLPQFGPGTLNVSSALTNSTGEASSTLTVTNIISQTRVGVCLLPANSPCATFDVFPVVSTAIVLRKLAGDAQYAHPGQAFMPLAIQVLDGSTPANAVAGVPVTFRTTVLRMPSSVLQQLDPDAVSGTFGNGAIISSGETTLLSNTQGVAAFAVTAPASEEHLRIEVQVTAGAASQRFTLHTWSMPPSETMLTQNEGANAGSLTQFASEPSIPETTSATIQPLLRQRAAMRSTIMVAVPEMRSATSPPPLTGATSETPVTI
ncbi:MAG: IPT/TIG domain-containing protein, partial [Candidatus Korobacteraceae bacterium]